MTSIHNDRKLGSYAGRHIDHSAAGEEHERDVESQRAAFEKWSMM